MSDPYQEAFEETLRNEVKVQQTLVKSVEIRQRWLRRDRYMGYSTFMLDYADCKELAVNAIWNDLLYE